MSAVPEVRGKVIRVFGADVGAINLANNPRTSARLQHIDVRHHCGRGKIAAHDGKDFKYVNMFKNNHANVLEKALAFNIPEAQRNRSLNCR